MYRDTKSSTSSSAKSTSLPVKKYHTTYLVNNNTHLFTSYILHLCCGKTRYTGNTSRAHSVLLYCYWTLHKVTVHKRTNGKAMSHHNTVNFCFSAIGAGETVDLVPHFHGHYIPDTSIVCGKK